MKTAPLYLVLLFCLIYQKGYTQAIDQIGKEKPVKVNGGLSLNNVFYHMDGAESRRNPYFWQINANVNFNILGVAVPFSASFSQQNSEFAQPFNQYGLSPTYKSLTVHLGWRSMSFNPYTLAGTNFLGAGVDYKPKNSAWEYSAVYGRFAKAIDIQNIANQTGDPAFERRGYGAKVKYTKKFGNIGVSFFKARDDKGSISRPEFETGLTPEDNLVMGLDGTLKLPAQTVLSFNFARSFYTSNIFEEEQKLQDFTFADNLGNILITNNSTSIDNAYDVKLSKSFKKWSLNFAYKKIAPGFRTMGSPFLNNDNENITGGGAASIFKGKVNFNLNVGVQRDNLDNAKRDRMVRLITNSSIAWNVGKGLNLNLSASNFSTNSFKVGVYDNTGDSLQFFQITQNYNLAASYSLQGKALPQSISTNFMYQLADDISGNGSNIQNVNAMYNITFPGSGLNLSVGINYFNNEVANLITNGVGPSVNLRKSVFKKKGSAGAMYSYAANNSNGSRVSDVHNMRLNLSFKVGERNSISIDGAVVNNSTGGPSGSTFTEYRGTLSYGYNF